MCGAMSGSLDQFLALIRSELYVVARQFSENGVMYQGLMGTWDWLWLIGIAYERLRKQ